jgi:hypothetical protein
VDVDVGYEGGGYVGDEYDGDDAAQDDLVLLVGGLL